MQYINEGKCYLGHKSNSDYERGISNKKLQIILEVSNMENVVKTKKKYPFGFYVCAISFTLERMAYYSSKWLIAIFIAASVPLTVKEKQRVAAIVLVTVFSVVFWIVWYLTYMPVIYHWGPDVETANKANWMIGNFQVPSAWFDSLYNLKGK